MTTGQLDIALKDIEQQLDAVSGALIRGEPVALEHFSANLKELIVNFSHLLDGKSAAMRNEPAFRSRVAALKSRLSDQRISLIRRAASIDGALHSLMPSASPATYATQSGRYGANGRQTGAFKVLSA